MSTMVVKVKHEGMGKKMFACLMSIFDTYVIRHQSSRERSLRTTTATWYVGI